jgi:hypothetical protein
MRPVHHVDVRQRFGQADLEGPAPYLRGWCVGWNTVNAKLACMHRVHCHCLVGRYFAAFHHEIPIPQRPSAAPRSRRARAVRLAPWTPTSRAAPLGMHVGWVRATVVARLRRGHPYLIHCVFFILCADTRHARRKCAANPSLPAALASRAISGLSSPTQATSSARRPGAPPRWYALVLESFSFFFRQYARRMHSFAMAALLIPEAVLRRA